MEYSKQPAKGERDWHTYRERVRENERQTHINNGNQKIRYQKKTTKQQRGEKDDRQKLSKTLINRKGEQKDKQRERMRQR